MWKSNYRPLLEQRKALAFKSVVNLLNKSISIHYKCTCRCFYVFNNLRFLWKFDNKRHLKRKKFWLHNMTSYTKWVRIHAFVCAFSENDPIIDFSPPLLFFSVISGYNNRHTKAECEGKGKCSKWTKTRETFFSISLQTSKDGKKLN